MIELVTVEDGRKFEITHKIRIPSKVDAESLSKALEGMLYLRKKDDPQCVYLINEVIDAQFQDITETTDKSEIANLEEKKSKLLDIIVQITGSETPKIA